MKNIKADITGKQFGDWEVLGYIGKSLWLCRCSCGVERKITKGKLTTGQTKSCGHSKLIDLTGKQFGQWAVIRYIGNMLWECQCSCDRHTIKNINGRHLREGISLDCGHNGSKKRIDLVGEKIGEWEVIAYAGNKYWNCKCSCGNTALIHGNRIRKREIKSCGHTNKIKRVDNQIFGKLTFIDYLSHGRYLCNCSCGNTLEVHGSNLRSGCTTSCGCSKDTKYTYEFLTESIDNYTNNYNEKPFIQELAVELGISYEYLIALVAKHKIRDKFNTKFSSMPEKEIYDTIKSIDNSIEIQIHNRTILNGQEIDLYIPSHKLAIEFNGNYWHSSMLKDRVYHQNKTIACTKQGIQLIHIFEYEWADMSMRIKIIDIIRSKVKQVDNIIKQARKCTIKVISKEEERQFIDINHLQGYTSSLVAYGLYDELYRLVSVMTFGRPRFNSRYEYELIRYCTTARVVIIGGAEKLFKHFISEYKPNNIITYCNIAKFKGNVYNKLGFKADKSCITEPSYRWVNRNYTEYNDTLSRYKTQKQNLIKAGYKEYGDTEDEIMTNLGYYKVYDSGNLRFVWEK